MNDLPRGVHTWAQADRYAIAVKYLHQTNFFKPETFALFAENGRVGVEFPLVAYLSARTAKICHLETYLPLIFKLLTSFIVIAGLYGFSMLVFPKSIPGILSIVFFSIGSPVILFYAFNYLPDITGMSLGLLSIGLYAHFLKNSRQQYLILAIVIGCIGGLLKMPILLYPIAYIAHASIERIIHKNNRQFSLLNMWIIFITGISLVAFYDYYYFIKVNKELWSGVFMSVPNMVRSLSDVSDILNGMIYWRSEYFNPIQYTIIFLSIIFVVLKYKKINNTYWRLFGILGIGFLCYLYGIGKQLIHHDYYILSSFFPIVLYSVGAVLHSIFNKIGSKYTWFIAAFFIVQFVCFMNKATLRNGDYYVMRKNIIQSDVEWLRGGKEKLDKKHIDKNAVIFVLYDFAPNTSLLYFNREGMVFNHEQMARKEPHLEYWMDRLKPNYFILQTKWKEQFIKDKPNLAAEWEEIKFDNFVLFKKP